MFYSINPFNGEKIAEFRILTEREIEEKISKADFAFKTWCRKPLEERIESIRLFASELQKRVEPYSRVISLEMGKILDESVREINKCILTAGFYADHAPDYLQTVNINAKHYKSYYTYEPYGVTLAIMPWNFPFWQALRFAIPNLILGNTVLLKHAPNVLWSAKNIEETFLEAGFAEGVFQTVNADIPEVEKIIADKRVKGVTLTGSSTAGSSVASLAGKYLKKSVLELGGSDPFVVLKDADLALAAKTATLSRFQNSGQTCIAAKRWIVTEEVYEPFKQLILEELNHFKTGDPFDTETTNGPVARLDLAEKIEGQVDFLIQSGAKPLSEWQRENCMIKPMILEVSRGNMLHFTEELFGPVGCLVKAKDENEAIEIANETHYGLGASIWTKDLERGEGLMTQIEAGNVFLNGMVKSEGLIPFGGINGSGYGRELGSYGIHEFAKLKSYVLSK